MPEAENANFKRSALRSSHKRKLQWRRIVNSWPFFVWIGIIAICAILYRKSAQYGVLPGVGQIVNQDVSPLQIARVKNIYVKIGDPVTKGQIVVQMDTTLVDAQLAQAEANLAGAQSTLAAYEGQLLGLVRTFDDDILKTQNAIEERKRQEGIDAAKLAELKSIQAARDKASKMNLIVESLADALRPEIAGLEKLLASYPAQIAMYERELAVHLRQRAELYKALRFDAEGDVMQAAKEKIAAEIKILKAAVEMRIREKETYSLRAETDGVVSDITMSPGVVAQPATSVVRIMGKSDRIIGYLPELRVGYLKIGDHGFAFRSARPPMKVVVVGMAPEIGPIPGQLSPISAPLGITFRAQRIVFQIEEIADFTPGERVQIRVISDSWSLASLKISDWWARAKHWLHLS
jgi:multidrug resistance efflux pump